MPLNERYTAKYPDKTPLDFRDWYDRYLSASPKEKNLLLDAKLQSFKTKNEAEDFYNMFTNTETLQYNATVKNNEIDKISNDGLSNSIETERLAHAIRRNSDYLDSLKHKKQTTSEYIQNIKKAMNELDSANKEGDVDKGIKIVSDNNIKQKYLTPSQKEILAEHYSQRAEKANNDLKQAIADGDAKKAQQILDKNKSVIYNDIAYSAGEERAEYVEGSHINYGSGSMHYDGGVRRTGETWEGNSVEQYRKLAQNKIDNYQKQIDKINKYKPTNKSVPSNMHIAKDGTYKKTSDTVDSLFSDDGSDATSFVNSDKSVGKLSEIVQKLMSRYKNPTNAYEQEQNGYANKIKKFIQEWNDGNVYLIHDEIGNKLGNVAFRVDKYDNIYIDAYNDNPAKLISQAIDRIAEVTTKNGSRPIRGYAVTYDELPVIDVQKSNYKTETFGDRINKIVFDKNGSGNELYDANNPDGNRILLTSKDGSDLANAIKVLTGKYYCPELDGKVFTVGQLTGDTSRYGANIPVEFTNETTNGASEVNENGFIVRLKYNPNGVLSTTIIHEIEGHLALDEYVKNGIKEFIDIRKEAIKGNDEYKAIKEKHGKLLSKKKLKNSEKIDLLKFELALRKYRLLNEEILASLSERGFDLTNKKVALDLLNECYKIDDKVRNDISISAEEIIDEIARRNINLLKSTSRNRLSRTNFGTIGNTQGQISGTQREGSQHSVSGTNQQGLKPTKLSEINNKNVSLLSEKELNIYLKKINQSLQIRYKKQKHYAQYGNTDAYNQIKQSVKQAEKIKKCIETELSNRNSSGELGDYSNPNLPNNRKSSETPQQERTKLHEDITKADMERNGAIKKSKFEVSDKVSAFNDSIKSAVGGKIKPEIARKLIPFLREGKGIPKSMPELEKAYNKLSKAKRNQLLKLSDKLYNSLSSHWEEYSNLHKNISTVNDSNYVPYKFEGATKEDQALLDKYFKYEAGKFNEMVSSNKSVGGFNNLDNPFDLKLFSEHQMYRHNNSLSDIIDNGLKVKIPDGFTGNGKQKFKDVTINVKPELDYSELATKHAYDLVETVENTKFINKFLYKKMSDGSFVVKSKPFRDTVNRIYEQNPDKTAIGKAYDYINNRVKFINFVGSFFHHNVLTQSALSVSAKGTVKALLTGGYRPINNKELVKDALKASLQLGSLSDAQVQEIEDSLDKAIRKLSEKGELGKGAASIAKILKAIPDANNKFLWDYLHNSYKLMSYDIQCQWYKKEFKTDTVPDEIKQEIAQLTNDCFGGQEYSNIGLTKKQVLWLQRLLLSPDWNVSALIRQPLSAFCDAPMQKLLNHVASKSEKGRKVREAFRKFGLASINNSVQGAEVRGKHGRRIMRNLAIVSMASSFLFNLIFRLKDQKEHPEYYPGGIIDYLTPWDNNKFSPGENAIEKFNDVLAPDDFLGRNEFGREQYGRVGKQFREFPELVENGIYSLTDKLAAKSAYPIRPYVSKASAALANSSKDSKIRNKYGWKGQESIIDMYKEGWKPFASKRGFVDSAKDSFTGAPSIQKTNRYSAAHEASEYIKSGDISKINSKKFRSKIRMNNLKLPSVLMKSGEELFREYLGNEEATAQIETNLRATGLGGWYINKAKENALKTPEQVAKEEAEYFKNKNKSN